mmetsp:Transcript_38706/g.83399  ORF Transcript_38706/g.83399 Transcript_38706/m.83399 type:complete len:156 (-) Transcript_38706:209-676(-)
MQSKSGAYALYRRGFERWVKLPYVLREKSLDQSENRTAPAERAGGSTPSRNRRRSRNGIGVVSRRFGPASYHADGFQNLRPTTSAFSRFVQWFILQFAWMMSMFALDVSRREEFVGRRMMDSNFQPGFGKVRQYENGGEAVCDLRVRFFFLSCRK